ncbi:MAG: hypothetical protein PUC01_10355 [Spirochaetales bacterium]|nr:hypothetical protein [Spirochaetales bacterium]
MSSDSKSVYSKSAEYNLANLSDERISRAYLSSKDREKRHNNEWTKRKVNINDIVAIFTPNAKIEQSYQKLIFKGDKYTIIADLNAGYLRIQNKEGKYIKLNGAVGSDSETHFKIMNREEMENAHSTN